MAFNKPGFQKSICIISQQLASFQSRCELMDEMYKLFSTRVCTNSVGQVVAAVMVNPLEENPSINFLMRYNYRDCYCQYLMFIFYSDMHCLSIFNK